MITDWIVAVAKGPIVMGVCRQAKIPAPIKGLGFM
jgi:hypothetical protein